MVREKTQTNAATLRLYLAVAFVCLGPVSMGAIVAYPSHALQSMSKDKESRFSSMTKDEGSWFGSLVAIGAALGSLVSGFFINRLGPKRAMHVSCIPMIVGWILIMSAQSVTMLLVARIIQGFCLGIICQVSVYITEISPPAIRGSMGGCFGFFITIGNVLAYGLGLGLDWFWSAGVIALPSILMFGLLFTIPESPYWLVRKCRKEDANKALTWLRGNTSNVNEEIQEIIKNVEGNDENEAVSIFDFFRMESLKPLYISMILMLFQQLSGIMAVIVYTADIFESAGSSLDPGVCALITGIIQSFGTVVSLLVVDRAGRKALLLASGSFMAGSLAVLGYYFKMAKDRGPEVVSSELGWLPLLCLVVYVFMFNIGYGPLPWIMMGELNTTRTKTVSCSIVTFFVWGMAFVVIKWFDSILDVLDKHGTYWFFALCCSVSLIYVPLFVPETKGKTLEEIQHFFSSEQLPFFVAEKESADQTVR